VFHARNAAHRMTGTALERIADAIGIEAYQDDISPQVEHLRAAGIDATAPRTLHAPPPLSWS
jgi:hypothetical protein